MKGLKSLSLNSDSAHGMSSYTFDKLLKLKSLERVRIARLVGTIAFRSWKCVAQDLELKTCDFHLHNPTENSLSCFSSLKRLFYEHAPDHLKRINGLFIARNFLKAISHLQDSLEELTVLEHRHFTSRSEAFKFSESFTKLHTLTITSDLLVGHEHRPYRGITRNEPAEEARDFRTLIGALPKSLKNLRPLYCAETELSCLRELLLRREEEVPNLEQINFSFPFLVDKNKGPAEYMGYDEDEAKD
jgi:hypothetical protein